MTSTIYKLKDDGTFRAIKHATERRYVRAIVKLLAPISPPEAEITKTERNATRSWQYSVDKISAQTGLYEILRIELLVSIKNPGIGMVLYHHIEDGATVARKEGAYSAGVRLWESLNPEEFLDIYETFYIGLR